jgi:hypothetical protein
MLVSDRCEYEDMIIYIDKLKAIEASLKYPLCRVEIFKISEQNEYKETYNYYKNGILNIVV